MVTLKATLADYPVAIAATTTFDVIVTHVCQTSSINSQTLPTPTDYQIEIGGTSVTIVSFPMHLDSEGDSHGDKLFCGSKKYSTGLTWLTVVPPNDPLTADFQLVAATNDFNLAGPQTVNLVVGFAYAGFT